MQAPIRRVCRLSDETVPANIRPVAPITIGMRVASMFNFVPDTIFDLARGFTPRE